MDALTAIAILALAAWSIMALLWGGFWRADQVLPSKLISRRQNWPGIAIIIPARNEAETISQVCQSLLDQDYHGQIYLVVIDDNSSDGTFEVAKKLDNVVVIEGKPLAQGWSGKLWAQSQGLEWVASTAPDAKYLLFTDADILHDKGSVRRLVLKAENEGRDMVSEMVVLRTDTRWERLLIPAFVFFFQKLYPFPWVNDAHHPMAAAAGGCMLVRQKLVVEAGGLEPIKHAIIDDCAFARHLKNAGGSLWLGLSSTTVSLRAYKSLSEIWNMVARTAFVQLKYSTVLLLICILGMVFLYLVPPVALIIGFFGGIFGLFAAGLAAWFLMAGLYLPTVKHFQLPTILCLSLPLASLLYVAMTVSSAIRHWQGRGSAWKGRTYG